MWVKVLILFFIFPVAVQAKDLVCAKDKAVPMWFKAHKDVTRMRDMDPSSSEYQQIMQTEGHWELPPGGCVEMMNTGFTMVLDGQGGYETIIKVHSGTKGVPLYVHDSEDVFDPKETKGSEAILEQAKPDPIKEPCDEAIDQTPVRDEITNYLGDGLKSEEEVEAYFEKHVCKATASSERCNRYREYEPILKRIAHAYDLPLSFFACFAFRESGFKFVADEGKVRDVIKKKLAGHKDASFIALRASQAYKRGKGEMMPYLEKLAEDRAIQPEQLRAVKRGLNNTAFGYMQIQPATAKGALDRIIGTNGKTGMRDRSISESYRLYLKELKELKAEKGDKALGIGEKAVLEFANMDKLESGKTDMFSNLESMTFNTPVNMVVAATALTVDLWGEDVKPRDDGKKSLSNEVLIEKLLRTAGKYNKGRSAFRKGCPDSMPFSDCMKQMQKLCQSNSSGWRENYRYIVSLHRCMGKGNEGDYQKLDSTCPDPVKEGLANE